MYLLGHIHWICQGNLRYLIINKLRIDYSHIGIVQLPNERGRSIDLPFMQSLTDY